MPDSADSRSRSEGDREVPLWLSLDILHEAGDWSGVVNRDALIEAAGRALASDPRFAARPQSEACVALSDDATVRELNARYRGKDKATDVLSFPGDDPGVGLGDILISVETAERNAAGLGRTLAGELDVLALHGFLHVLGYDHETDDGTMDRLERKLRRRLL